MWSRRQASEIAIHRFDAEQERGITTHFEPTFATDMLDELLSGFAPRSGSEEMGVDSERLLHVRARRRRALVPDHRPERRRHERDGGDADLIVTAAVAELYLLMWIRTDESSVTLAGDAELMDLWRTSCRVRWSGGE